MLAGWYFLPTLAEVPFGGVPLTRMSLFAFAAAWLLLFAALPWRERLGRGWFWSSFGVLLFLMGLKIAAAGMSAPQGLVGTYEPLVGVADTAPYARAVVAPDEQSPPPKAPARGWRRLDRALQFRNNGFSPFHDSFHLTFLNHPPYDDRPRGPGDAGFDPARPQDALELAPVRVTWEGVIDFPRTAIYRFYPRTDGWWSVWVEGVGVVGAGGPDADVPEAPAPRSLDAGPQRVVIRYLRPGYPAETPRPDRHFRFELRWDDGAGDTETVNWRRLYPIEVSQIQTVWNRAGEGLAWASFGGACALCLIWLIFVVDWRRAVRPFFTDRMVLFLLALWMFAVGFLEVTGRTARDPNWCVMPSGPRREHLARALLIAGHGDPLPTPGSAAAPATAPAAAPATAPAALSGNPVVNVWLRTAAMVFDGLLGPTAWYPDDPDDRPPGFRDSPLLDYYLGGLLWVFEDRLGVICLFQILVSIATMAMVYAVGRAVFGRHAGLLGAAALALDPHFAPGAASLLADLPAALAALTAVWAAVRARRLGRSWSFAAAAVPSAACFLLRPDLLLLPAACLAYLAWPADPAVGWRRRLLRPAAFAAVFLALWSLVPVRNHQLGAAADWLPTGLGERLAAGNGVADPDPADGSRPGADEFLAAASADPGEIAFAFWGKFLRLWGVVGLGAQLRAAVETGDYLLPVRHVGMPLLYLAVLALSARAGLCTRRPACLLAAAAVAAACVPLVVLDFDDRLRLPMIPLVHVFAGAWLGNRLAERAAARSDEGA